MIHGTDAGMLGVKDVAYLLLPVQGIHAGTGVGRGEHCTAVCHEAGPTTCMLHVHTWNTPTCDLACQREHTSLYKRESLASIVTH